MELIFSGNKTHWHFFFNHKTHGWKRSDKMLKRSLSDFKRWCIYFKIWYIWLLLSIQHNVLDNKNANIGDVYKDKKHRIGFIYLIIKWAQRRRVSY